MPPADPNNMPPTEVQPQVEPTPDGNLNPAMPSTPSRGRTASIILIAACVLSVLANGALGYYASSKTKTITTQEATIATQTDKISTLDQTVASKDTLVKKQKDSIDACQDIVTTNSNCPVCPAATTCPTPAKTTTTTTRSLSSVSSIIQPPAAPSD